MASKNNSILRSFKEWLGKDIFSKELEDQYLNLYYRFLNPQEENPLNHSVYHWKIFQANIDSWASKQLYHLRVDPNVEFENNPIAYPVSKDPFTGFSSGFLSKQININEATIDELRQIPGIGPSSAKKIELNRNFFGSFESLEDLVNRRCLSEEALNLSKGYLSIKNIQRNDNRFTVDNLDFRTYISLCYSLESDKSVVSLKRFGLNKLEAAVCFFNSHINKHSRILFNQPFINSFEKIHNKYLNLKKSDGNLSSASLDNKGYFKLLKRIIPKAEKSILIQAPSIYILHIPTLRIILDLLVESVNKNIDVRILYDGSYSPGALESDDIAYLKAQNVSCKALQMNNRIHSRVILIDEEHIICGSQSWSATSFFHSQELSLYIKSNILAKEQLMRFEKLWKI